MRRFLLCVAAITGLLGSLMVAPANATFIGREGKIAFVRANQVYTVAKTGGAVTKLTSSGKNYRPKFSPDGLRIAYINEVAGKPDVWVMSAKGLNKKRVTKTGDVRTEPAWSPDGKTLAYGAGPSDDAILTTIRSTAPFGVGAPFVVHRMGRHDEDSFISTFPWIVYSPDGTTITLYNADSENSPDNAIHEINIASRDEETTILTNGDCCGQADFSDLVYGPNSVFGYAQVNYGDPAADPIPPVEIDIVYPGFASQQGDKGPAPSPLGTHMAFTNDASGTPKIMTATISGAQRRVIVTNGYQPDWQSLR